MRINVEAERLKIILDKHEKWLKCETDGERADLRHADLSGANLVKAEYLRAQQAQESNGPLPIDDYICGNWREDEKIF